MGGTIRETWQRNADIKRAADLYYEKVTLEVAKQKGLDSSKEPAPQRFHSGTEK